MRAESSFSCRSDAFPRYSAAADVLDMTSLSGVQHDSDKLGSRLNTLLAQEIYRHEKRRNLPENTAYAISQTHAHLSTLRDQLYGGQVNADVSLLFGTYQGQTESGRLSWQRRAANLNGLLSSIQGAELSGLDRAHLEEFQEYLQIKHKRNTPQYVQNALEKIGGMLEPDVTIETVDVPVQTYAGSNGAGTSTAYQTIASTTRQVTSAAQQLRAGARKAGRAAQVIAPVIAKGAVRTVKDFFRGLRNA